MVEQILGRRQTEDIFFSAMLTGMMTEKQASGFLDGMEKGAKADLLDWAKAIGGTLAGGGSMVLDAFKAAPSAMLNTALLGASIGGLGAMGYDVIKERVSEEDPETKHNNEIEALYSGKARELEDAKWMANARARRDKLKRGLKKMTSKEYASEYKALVKLLREKEAS